MGSLRPLDDFLHRAPIARPRETLREWLKRAVIGLGSRPHIGGVDALDLESGHSGVLFGLSLLNVAGVVAVFCAFMTTLTIGQTSQVYLSPSQQSVESNVQCEEVPLSVTGTFFATYLGVWNTNPSYSATESKTLFVLDLVGSEITLNEYSATMQRFLNQLYQDATKFSSRSLIFNAMLLAVVSYSDPKTSMGFYSNADPAVIFNQEVEAATVSSKEGVCDSFNTTGRYLSGTFDVGSKAFTLSMPLVLSRDYMLDPHLVLNDPAQLAKLKRRTTCPWQEKHYQSVLDGNWGEYSEGVEKFSFDIRSATAAIAVNLGYTSVDIYDSFRREDTPGLIGYYDAYYRFPPFAPFWCLDKHSSVFHNFSESERSGPDICFVRDGKYDMNEFYLPVMAQFFQDDRHCDANGNCRYSLCDCADAASTHTQCNQLQFALGLIYDNSPTFGLESLTSYIGSPLVKLGLKMQRMLIDNPASGDVDQLRAAAPLIAYTLSIANSPATSSNPILSWKDSSTGKVYDNSWAKGQSYNQLLHQAYEDFCDAQECAAFVFQTYRNGDGYLNRYRISYTDLLDDKTRALNASVTCRNFLSKEVEDQLSTLISNPPTQLVNNYLECKKTLQGALVGSIGNAVASAAFFSSLGWIVLGYIIVSWLRIKNKKGETKADNVFSSREKLEASQVLQQLRSDSVIECLRVQSSALELLHKENGELKRRIVALEGSVPQQQQPGFDPSSAKALEGVQQQLELVALLHSPDQSSSAFKRAGDLISDAMTKSADCNKTEVTSNTSTTKVAWTNKEQAAAAAVAALEEGNVSIVNTHGGETEPEFHVTNMMFHSSSTNKLTASSNNSDEKREVELSKRL